MKRVAYSVGWILVGVFMVFYGVHNLGADTVPCGSHSMKAADTCEVRHTRYTNVESYSEHRNTNYKMGWLEVGFGASLATLGVVVLVAGRRRKIAPAEGGESPPLPDGG